MENRLEVILKFNGSDEQDVQEFLFKYSNYVMQGKTDEQKAECIYAYLDGVALSRYREKFIKMTGPVWILSDEGRHFDTVSDWLASEFQKDVAPDQLIRNAVDMKLNFGCLSKSLEDLCKAYKDAGFNDKAKYGMLRKMAMENPELRAYLMLKGPNSFTALKASIEEYVKNSETFAPPGNPGKMQATQPITMDPEMFSGRPAVSPHAIDRVKEDVRGMEDRFDNRLNQISSQLESLTLTIKKGHTTPNGNSDIICSFCNKPGHYANRCPDNPHRNTRCGNCGKMGHHESTCFKKNTPYQGRYPTLAGSGQTPGKEVRILERKPEIINDNNKKKPESTMIVATDSDPEAVVTTKRDQEGNPMSKKQKILDSYRDQDLIMPPKITPNLRSKPRKTQKARKNKPRKGLDFKDILSYVKKYNLSAELAAAPSGLTFGQLLRGDAEEARKDLKKILNSKSVSRINNTVSDSPRRLKLVSLRIHGFKVQALFDSGAIPDLISQEIAESLDMRILPTNKSITVANGTSSTCVGKVENVPVMFSKKRVELSFLVVDGLPFDIIVGCPTMESLETCIDLGKRCVSMQVDGKLIELPLNLETPNMGNPERTDSDDFTSEDESSESDYPESTEDETQGSDKMISFPCDLPESESDQEVSMVLGEDSRVDGKSSPCHDCGRSAHAHAHCREGTSNYPEGRASSSVKSAHEVPDIEVFCVSIKNNKFVEENIVLEPKSSWPSKEFPLDKQAEGIMKAAVLEYYIENRVDMDHINEKTKLFPGVLFFEKGKTTKLYCDKRKVAPRSEESDEVDKILDEVFGDCTLDESLDENFMELERQDPYFRAELEVVPTGVIAKSDEEWNTFVDNLIPTIETENSEVEGEEYAKELLDELFDSVTSNTTFFNAVMVTTEETPEDPETPQESADISTLSDESRVKMTESKETTSGLPTIEDRDFTDISEFHSLEDDQGKMIKDKFKHLECKKFKKQLVKFLLENDVVAWSLFDLRPTDVPIEHTFKLTDYEPIYHNLRRQPPKWDAIIEEHVTKMLNNGIISASTSPWSFPVVIASKKDGSTRFCIDYRKLNKRMISDRFPIPNASEILESFDGCIIFTALDLFSGYWQIQLAEDLKDITTFTCKYGTFRFEVMPFGLTNAPRTFQRFMQHVLRGIDGVRVYIDDIVIFSKTIEEHLETIQKVFERFSEFNLKIKLKKCFFAQESIELLGHIVGKDGVKVDPKKIEKIKNCRVPTTKTEVRGFIGMASYYRRFIKDFAKISSPLHSLTSPNTRFEWKPEMQKSFEILKEKLCSTPVLAHPNFEKPFVVETDASNHCVGAVLSQKDEEGKLHPIQFASRTMNQAEQNYSACEKEALAVIFALKKFRVYLLSQDKFTLITDHQALKHAFQKPDIHHRLARWMDFIAEYNFEILYRAGNLNRTADFLSRLEEGPSDEGVEDTLDVCAIVELDGLEKKLIDVSNFIQGFNMNDVADENKDWVRRNAKLFTIWEGKLYRKTSAGLRVVPPIESRKRILEIFHDDIGHWNLTTTRQFVMERYWWPLCHKDIYEHVKTCNGCQKSSPIPKYRTTLRLPIAPLFETFSIDFAGPFPESKAGDKYILIAVEHLTNWPLAIPTIDSTASTVMMFIENEIITPFSPPKRLISDNATCFGAQSLQRFLKSYGIEWKPVSAYAPMSNGKAERMVGTIKNAMNKSILNEDENDRDWREVIPQVLYGYRRRKGAQGQSPFELMFGIQPRIIGSEIISITDNTNDDTRKMELLANSNHRAEKALRLRDPKPKPIKIVKFKVGDKVLVAHGQATKKSVKWPAFKSKFYGPCKVLEENHPLYKLQSSSGKTSRRPIHARRLVAYNERRNRVSQQQFVSMANLAPTDPPNYIVSSYRHFLVGGHQMSEWLGEYSLDTDEEHEITHFFMNICLFFRVVHGHLLTLEGYHKLVRFFFSFQEGRFVNLGEIFVEYMYHYTIGRIGTAEREELSEVYSETLEVVYNQLEQPDQPHLIGYYLQPDLNYGLLPYPFLEAYQPMNSDDDEPNHHPDVVQETSSDDSGPIAPFN